MRLRPVGCGILGGVTRVERLGPDDWREAREVRLAALADAPLAFASTHAREVAFDEATWRARLRSSAWFLARDDAGRAVGVIALIVEGPGEDHVVGMWVAPEVRGGETAEALLAAALASARPAAEAVVLWVADGNARARRFYERAGFRGTGERQPLPSAPDVGEEKLRLRLR
jgi:ribosomal protein S18 acetylase RimI-like enzyme